MPRPSIYISYCHDLPIEQVSRVVTQLVALNRVDVVFIDKSYRSISDNALRIENAISSAAAMLVLHTESYDASEDCQLDAELARKWVTPQIVVRITEASEIKLDTVSVSSIARLLCRGP